MDGVRRFNYRCISIRNLLALNEEACVKYNVKKAMCSHNFSSKKYWCAMPINETKTTKSKCKIIYEKKKKQKIIIENMQKIVSTVVSFSSSWIWC